MKKHEKFIGFIMMVLFLIGIGFLYSNKKHETFEAGKEARLKEIHNEMLKGRDFYMSFENKCMKHEIHFIPLKKRGKVYITGAGDNARQSRKR